jgi:universal stress protein E
MPKIRRILIAVGALGTKSPPTVVKAAQIARACGAQVELYHSLDSPVYADLRGLHDFSVADLERELKLRAVHRLEGIADGLRQQSLRVNVCAEWDYPAYEAIVRRALSIKADLIVASGQAARHRFASLMRLTDWELVRLSPVPVLLVKSPHPYDHPGVLAAVDPSHAFAKPLQLDKRILEAGNILSRALQGSLHAVHAYARVITLPATPITPAVINALERHAQRAAKAGFDRVLRPTRIPRARRYLIARDPINGILEGVRQSRCAIVVMGAISRTGFKRLLVGNTAEKMLDDLHCDVLVVKSPKFHSRVPRASRGASLLLSASTNSLGYY